MLTVTHRLLGNFSINATAVFIATYGNEREVLILPKPGRNIIENLTQVSATATDPMSKVPFDRLPCRFIIEYYLISSTLSTDLITF